MSIGLIVKDFPRRKKESQMGLIPAHGYILACSKLYLQTRNPVFEEEAYRIEDSIRTRANTQSLRSAMDRVFKNKDPDGIQHLELLALETEFNRRLHI